MAEPSPTGAPLSPILVSFFERLGPLEALVRIILSEAPISARLTFRGEPPGEVRVDYSVHPARISSGHGLPAARIQVTIDARVMHRVLLGELHPGEALGQRELLLRGSAMDLARFIPLIGFAPLLYREHLADLGLADFVRPGAPLVTSQETHMERERFRGDPIQLRSLSRTERAIFRAIEQAAHAAGYGMGLLRHRYLRNLSLFDVLGALSRGVEAGSAAAGQGSRRPGAARPG